MSHKIIGLRLKEAFLPYFYQDNCFSCLIYLWYIGYLIYRYRQNISYI